MSVFSKQNIVDLKGVLGSSNQEKGVLKDKKV